MSRRGYCDLRLLEAFVGKKVGLNQQASVLSGVLISMWMVKRKWLVNVD